MKETHNMVDENIRAGAFAINSVHRESADGSIVALVCLAPSKSDNFFFSGVGRAGLLSVDAQEGRINLATIRAASDALYSCETFLLGLDDATPTRSLGVAANEYYDWGKVTTDEVYNQIKSTRDHFLAGICGSDTVLRSVIAAGLGKEEEGTPEGKQEQIDPVTRATADEWYAYLAAEPTDSPDQDDIFSHIDKFTDTFGLEGLRGLVLLMSEHLPAITSGKDGARAIGSAAVRDYILTLVPKKA
jgi:hypothetical protein